MRDWISAVWVNWVCICPFGPRAGSYTMFSKTVTYWDNERLTEVTVVRAVTGSTNDISRTNASSEPPSNWREFSNKWIICALKLTLTIHRGAACLQPSILSVRITPVTGSTERSTTSTDVTCAHLGFGYLCQIPRFTCDQGWLWQLGKFTNQDRRN